MTDKIIINGKEEKETKILFSCKHIDDLAAYDMMRKGIKITPDNAPVSDFESMLIENTNSPYGFSSICKRSSKEDVWEFDGFGHSGACSIATALLKELKHEEATINELEDIAKKYQTELEKDALSLPSAIESIIERKEAELQAEKQKVKKLEEENSTLKTASIMIDNNKYEQALKEIKGIAKDLRTRTDYHSPDEVNLDIDRILQKCEVLEG